MMVPFLDPGNFLQPIVTMADLVIRSAPAFVSRVIPQRGEQTVKSALTLHRCCVFC